MMTELVTVQEAAALLGVPAHIVARELDRAHLPAGGVYDDGRQLLFSLARVRELVPPPRKESA